MPDLKGVREMSAPAWLSDLYFDMRERRLLPLIALVVVAIAAVPFLLGDSEEVAAPPIAEDVAGEAAIGAEPTQLTVVEARPGLRDYKKRLGRRSPTDPFAQKYTSVPRSSQLEETGGGSAGGGAGGTGGGDPSGGEEEVSVTVTERRSGGDSGGSGDDERSYYAYRPNVRFGVAGSDDLTTYRHLDFGKALPNRNPVILFFGVSEGGKRVAFDVSPEVQLVKTKGRCIGGHQSCGTLILKQGQAATIITGKPNRSFRLKITGIDFIEVERPKPRGKAKREERIGFGAQSFSK